MIPFNSNLADRLPHREPSDTKTQPIAVGIDPGSKKEGLTVKSASHTYLNINADAVTFVKEAKADQLDARRSRRFRRTPCRKPRANRARGGIPPSTKARWQWKLRLLNWLRRLFPICDVVVENIKAGTKGNPRWDIAFSPLEVGKQWFYGEVKKLARLHTFDGHETAQMRDLVSNAGFGRDSTVAALLQHRITPPASRDRRWWTAPFRP